MSSIYKLDLQGLHVDLIEKFGYENIHSTYYDVFDDMSQNTSVYLYSSVNPFYHINIYDKNIQMLLDGNKYFVTSERAKYGDFKIKHYERKDVINLITVQSKFDIYSEFADIIEIIDRNCYRTSFDECNEEVLEKCKTYIKI